MYIVQPRLSGPHLSGPHLSRLAGDQKMHYYACVEGVASDLLWVWSACGQRVRIIEVAL